MPAKRKRLTDAEYAEMAADYAAEPPTVDEVVSGGVDPAFLRKGRPAEGTAPGKTPGFTVRLPDAIRVELALVAQAEGSSPSELIRRAVVEYIGSHPVREPLPYSSELAPSRGSNRTAGHVPSRKLFDEGPRSDTAPRRDTEGSYEFLNRRAGTFWDRTRKVIDEWYAEFPDDTNDLRKRFQDKSERQHLAAWWELYIRTLFWRLRYDVKVHPEVLGTTKNPDFLISNDSTSFYVECVTMFGDDGLDNPAGWAWICECTNRAKHPDFMVNLDIEKVGTEQPRVTEITKPLENWLENLDADAIRADIEAGRQPPRFELTVRDWKLIFEPWPVLPEKRGNHRRMIAVYPTPGAVWIKDVEEIRKRLDKKGAKYGSGKLDKPLIVALLCWDAVDEPDLTKALFGSTAVTWLTNDPTSVRSIRVPDGYWRPGTDARGSRVSAVLFGNYLRPWRVADMLPELWINPWASMPVPDVPPFATLAVDADGNFVTGAATRTAEEVFGLPPQSPNVDQATAEEP